MKINLVNFTDNAKELLIFSKTTRLLNSPDSFQRIKEMTEEDKDREITYIFSTIKSSLEFVDYVFLIQDVTRAFTHQLVRHRVGVSFAQQSQRTVDVSGFYYSTPESLVAENRLKYVLAMDRINESYRELVNCGVAPEDARGILPTNIYTNILMKINLRSLSEMMNSRLCNRAQKEFRDVMNIIQAAVVAVHPWAESILHCYCDIHKKCFFKNGKGCKKYGE